MDQAKIENFLDSSNVIAVVGASRDPEKYGHKIYKDLKDKGFEVYPVNPKADTILSDKAFSSLEDLPEKPDVVDVVVPPDVSMKIVEQCDDLGIDKVWLQPGSESDEVIDFCQEHEIELVHDTCMMLKSD